MSPKDHRYSKLPRSLSRGIFRVFCLVRHCTQKNFFLKNKLFFFFFQNLLPLLSLPTHPLHSNGIFHSPNRIYTHPRSSLSRSRTEQISFPPRNIEVSTYFPCVLNLARAMYEPRNRGGALRELLARFGRSLCRFLFDQNALGWERLNRRKKLLHKFLAKHCLSWKEFVVRLKAKSTISLALLRVTPGVLRFSQRFLVSCEDLEISSKSRLFYTPPPSQLVTLNDERCVHTVQKQRSNVM